MKAGDLISGKTTPCRTIFHGAGILSSSRKGRGGSVPPSSLLTDNLRRESEFYIYPEIPDGLKGGWNKKR